MQMTKRLSALFAAALLGAAGCSGSQGDTGPAGPSGPAGGDETGAGGMATITVHVSFQKVNGTTLAAPVNAPGVYCFTNPDYTTNSADVVAEATTDASGNAVFTVPGGWYIFKCRPAKAGSAAAVDYADDMKLTDKVYVAAGGAKTVEVQANRTNPLYFTAAPKISGAKVNTAGAKLSVGATSVPATIEVAQVLEKSIISGVSPVPSQEDPAVWKFDVPDVDVILAGLSATWDLTAEVRTNGRGIWKAFELPVNAGFVGLGDGVARSMAKALAFDVTATATIDGKTYTAKAPVTGGISGLQDIQGGSSPSSPTGTFGVVNGVGPIGVMVIASDTAAGAYSWTLTAQDKDQAPFAAPALKGANTRNPYFIPELEGIYTLTNSAPATPTVLKFAAASYVGLLKADGSASACGECHNNPAPGAPGWYTIAFQGYASTEDYFFRTMGVHGNHNYFSNPASRDKAAAGGFETIFQWGLQGVDYAPTCYRCHTTGSFWVNSNGPESTVSNNGFQDRMNALDAAAKLTDPTAVPMRNAWVGDGADHYSSLDGSLKAMGGIQCESCHGPGSMHRLLGGADGTTHEVKGIVRPYGVSACAVCHDAPGHHDKVELWSQSGHGNMALALVEGAASASCARCHGAQGFVAFTKQVAGKGSDCASYQDSTGKAITLTAGKLANGNLPYADQLYVKVGAKDANGKYVCKQANAADLAGIGIAKATIQPMTCQACHNPHSTELRVNDNTGMLAAGFSVEGAGAGALCMTCHNGRNGPRGDNVTIASIASSHTPTQTELLMGQNFYWVNGMVSAHAAVGDTCVGCHVKLVPDSLQTGNDNHTFEADDSICKSCHGASTKPEGLYGRYNAGVANLKVAMLAALADGRTQFDIVGSARTVVIDLAVNKPVISGYDRSGVAFTFATDVENPNAASGTIAAGKTLSAALNKIMVTATTTPICTNNGRMAKAGWNLTMLNNKSAAVHNPSLTFQVLSVSAQKVQDASAGTL